MEIYNFRDLGKIASPHKIIYAILILPLNLSSFLLELYSFPLV